MPSSLSLFLSNTHTLTHRNTTLIFITPVLFHFIFFLPPLLGYLSTKPKANPTCSLHLNFCIFFDCILCHYILWLYFFPLSKTADFWPLDSTGILSFLVFSMVWQALDYLYPPYSAFCPIPPLCSQTGLLCLFLSTSDTQSFGPLLWVISSAWNVHFQHTWLTKLLLVFSSMLKSHPPSDIYLDTLFNSASVHIHQTPLFPISLFCSLCFSLLRTTFDTFYCLFVHCPTPTMCP